ncbi:hypothetical protein M0802_016600 [Mischocyttarus mexicanus]|nr:hypothetical protein M0802_016600 [Mischocyttarus mexicanus]
MPVIDLLVDKDYVKNNDSLTKFLTDSGATEHLTNSKLILKTFDKTKADYIKCANNDVHADLSSKGAGTVDVKLDKDRIMILENVICARDLSESLLLLRKFADMGLSIYLDNQQCMLHDHCLLGTLRYLSIDDSRRITCLLVGV